MPSLITGVEMPGQISQGHSQAARAPGVVSTLSVVVWQGVSQPAPGVVSTLSVVVWQGVSQPVSGVVSQPAPGVVTGSVINLHAESQSHILSSHVLYMLKISPCILHVHSL